MAKHPVLHILTGGLGLMAFLESVRYFARGEDLSGLGRNDFGKVGFGPRGRRLGPTGKGDIIEKSELTSVRNIDERVAYIVANIAKHALSPKIKEVANRILSTKCKANGEVRWCVPEKNANAEIAAMFYALRQPSSPIALRYTRDHAYVDQFTAPDKLLKLHIGDCDDGTSLLGALLMSIGYPVRLRIIQDKNSPSWSHIYLLVNRATSGRADWVPLDWSVPGARADAGKWGRPGNPFWEIPGAAEVARTGRPAGYVVKLKDYDVRPR